MQRDQLFIAEMIDAAERIIELTVTASVADLVIDQTRRESLLWSFTVLGEASSQLSDHTKNLHPSVSWRAPTAMRNRIIHSYWQTSPRILLATAQDDIPQLLADLRRVETALRIGPRNAD